MIAELEAVAQKHGYKLADLTGGKKAKVASRTKYKHPEDSSLTWSGRGRQPNWIKDELSTGKALIDFAIEKSFLGASGWTSSVPKTVVLGRCR